MEGALYFRFRLFSNINSTDSAKLRTLKRFVFRRSQIPINRTNKLVNDILKQRSIISFLFSNSLDRQVFSNNTTSFFLSDRKSSNSN